MLEGDEKKNGDLLLPFEKNPGFRETREERAGTEIAWKEMYKRDRENGKKKKKENKSIILWNTFEHHEVSFGHRARKETENRRQTEKAERRESVLSILELQHH